MSMWSCPGRPRPVMVRCSSSCRFVFVHNTSYISPIHLPVICTPSQSCHLFVLFFFPLLAFYLSSVITPPSHLTRDTCIRQAGIVKNDWQMSVGAKLIGISPDGNIKGLVDRSKGRPYLNCLFVINMKRVSAQQFKDR